MPLMLEHTDTLPDALLELELAVARRADELARLGSERTPAEDVSCWMRAERDVLAKTISAERSWR